ncbi:ABC transporter permease [Streptomyces pathocidini]|uniref:ABC transporter permease n=1 Tax=Streptomyces pathocidini TaxID=1650571 RepID=A0ABW7UWC9_9ACTN|nr:ABC transporter permease subunit [Streptomyces pathocidini]
MSGIQGGGLVWSRSGRLGVWAAFAVVFVPVILAPLAVVVLAAFAGSWNGVLPGSLTGRHLEQALSGEQLASLSVSVQTGLLSGLTAVAVGGWAAVAVRGAPPALRRLTDAVLHLPIAVSSVVIGLGLLVAFGTSPLLAGTMGMVVIAHVVLVLAFAHSTVSAALDRLDPAYALVAGSLGATPARVLWRIRLPLLTPALSAAGSLSIALSMGEVGATIMVYPASWRTLPVSVFALTDRGRVFLAAAETLVLLAATLLLLLALGRMRTRAAK